MLLRQVELKLGVLLDVVVLHLRRRSVENKQSTFLFVISFPKYEKQNKMASPNDDPTGHRNTELRYQRVSQSNQSIRRASTNRHNSNKTKKKQTNRKRNHSRRGGKDQKRRPANQRGRPGPQRNVANQRLALPAAAVNFMSN